MFNLTRIVLDSFIQRLQASYRRTYGNLKPEYADLIGWVATIALENIANSDAPYHDVEHTLLVTLTGQEILRGKHLRSGNVSCEDWLHVIVALLCHDIGYVKGVCRQDKVDERLYAAGTNNDTIALAAGSTDASLTPYHVDRGKLFIEEYFGSHELIDLELLKRHIELTRFPVPADDAHQDTTNYSGLVRAADLIGQLSDPYYLQKMPALFSEFEEIGTNKILGYRHVGDLRAGYPNFFWNGVYHYLGDGLKYLEVTDEGKQMIAHLYGNVLIVEHEMLLAARKLQGNSGEDSIDRSLCKVI